MPKSRPSHPLEALWANSVAGMRANLLPGIALWIVALGIVLIYYFVDSSRPAFTWIADLKESFGYLFSGISTGLFGGIIPFAWLYFAKRIPGGQIFACGLFYTIYWAVRGMEVDAFYRLQDWLFGSGIQWQTIATKVSIDQFVYSLLWSAPVTAVFYGWKDLGFTWSAFRAQFSRRLITIRIPSVLLSTWLVWIPATAIIYSLPLPLQVPLFNLVLCFFVLLMSALQK